jgi:hypothetical protein
MNIQSLYYIKKYNDLIEQINRLKHENSLLEGLASGTLSSSQRDTTTSSSTTTTSAPTSPNPPSPPIPSPPFNTDINADGVVDGGDLGAVLAGWNNPYDGANLGSILAQWGTNPSNPSNPSEPEEPSNPQNPPTQTPYDFNRPRGTSVKDIASLSNRNFVNNFGL